MASLHVVSAWLFILIVLIFSAVRPASRALCPLTAGPFTNRPRRSLYYLLLTCVRFGNSDSLIALGRAVPSHQLLALQRIPSFHSLPWSAPAASQPKITPPLPPGANLHEAGPGRVGVPWPRRAPPALTWARVMGWLGHPCTRGSGSVSRASWPPGFQTVWCVVRGMAQ